MIDDDEGESRFSRWSKRKIAVAREECAETPAHAAETIDVEEQALEDAELQAELQANREAAEAIDLESLSAESDFSVFMKDGVPEMLKKQAMASLWRTSPIFANVDGLVDYDDDFGSPDLIMKTFKSAYQAGRGYLDLFKEDEDDEEVAEDAIASAEGENAPDLDDEIESDLDDDEDVAEVQGSAGEEEDGEANVPVEELVLMEPEPLPKVSLRRRLELERSS